jgi:hypothetical protein
VRNPIGGRGEKAQVSVGSQRGPAAVCFWLSRPETFLSLVTFDFHLHPAPPSATESALACFLASSLQHESASTLVADCHKRPSYLEARAAWTVPYAHEHDPSSCHCHLPITGPALQSEVWSALLGIPRSASPVMGKVRTPHALSFACCHVDYHSHASSQRSRPTALLLDQSATNRICEREHWLRVLQGMSPLSQW